MVLGGGRLGRRSRIERQSVLRLCVIGDDDLTFGFDEALDLREAVTDRGR
jgi:hypothetical protein